MPFSQATTDQSTEGQQTNKRMDHDTSATSWGFILKRLLVLQADQFKRLKMSRYVGMK